MHVVSRLDVGFILYDIGVLAYDRVANGGQNWKLHAGALAADVAGALIPFATGGGAAYRAGNKLADVAKQADALVPAGGSAATRGSKVHGQFDNIVEGGAAGKNVVGERAYVGGNLDPRYRPKGSSNPDAILGNPSKPTAAFDLKTGKSGISNTQMTKYERNLPDETPTYMVTPNGHNVPRPQNLAGFGALTNTGVLLNDALSPYSGSANQSFFNPRASK